MFATWDNGKLVLDFNELQECSEVTVRIVNVNSGRPPAIYIDMKTEPYQLNAQESWGVKITKVLEP